MLCRIMDQQGFDACPIYTAFMRTCISHKMDASMAQQIASPKCLLQRTGIRWRKTSNTSDNLIGIGPRWILRAYINLARLNIIT